MARKQQRIDVFVEDVDGKPIEAAEVQIRSPRGPGGGTAKWHADERKYCLGVEAAGTYEITVKSRDKNPETRSVRVSPGHTTVTFVLGSGDEPFYFASGEKVYFEPDRQSFLLVVRGDNADDAAHDVLAKRQLKGEAMHPPGPQRGKAPADASFVRIGVPGGDVEASGELIASVADELRRRGLTVVPALVVKQGDRPLQGLTNELVVRFESSVTKDEVERIAKQLGLKIERSVLYAGNGFVLSRAGAPSYELLKIAQILKTQFPVIYAEPNLLMQVELDAYTPNDFLWASLPHMPLVNCDDAWDVLDDIDVNRRGGSANITIAVFDPHGVSPNHPDLTANLTDGTSKLVQSFNFNAMAAQTVAALGGDHGTQCAGSATSAFDNNRGIAGIAPNCHLIGARIPSVGTGIDMADAFIWAAGFNTGNTNPSFPPLPLRSADVISNSWGVSNAALSAAMRDALDFLTVYGRDGRGCVVTFSTGNLGYVQFSNVRRFAAYERTIAVGASVNSNPTSPTDSDIPDPTGDTTNLTVTVDTRALYSPYGPEMDLVAPSHNTYLGGALVDPILSAVRVGTGAVDGCPGAATCNDYGSTFGGTSHASPSVAGAAALVLSVNPGLSWVQVREILRASAAKIDFAQANAIGAYVDNDGDGIGEFSQWYGYGRLDVNAAVIRARDLTNPADIVVRENLSDVGNVPSPGWHAVSPDIWVRTTDDAIPALAYGAAPPHQNPVRNQDNYVFCRVKNRGGAASNEIYVRAMITHFPGFEFRYAEEFIPTNRPGAAVPNPLLPGTYLIDEVRIDDLAAGDDEIVKMTWPAALVPPAQVTIGTTTVNWHPCLLLEASPHDGPLPAAAGIDIRRYNNIAQRNITIDDPSDSSSDFYHAIIMGTTDPSGVGGLVIDRTLLSPEARIYLHLPDPKHMSKLLGHVEKQAQAAPHDERAHQPGSIRVLTKARLEIEHENGKKVVISAAPGTVIECGCPDLIGKPELQVRSYQGLKAIELGRSRDPLKLPLRLGPRQFTPIYVAVPRGDAKRRGELRLTQYRGDGQLSGGYSIVF